MVTPLSNNDNAQIGVIGLAVMGANLARNLAAKGWKTMVFNRTQQRTLDLLQEHPHPNLIAANSLQDLIAGLVKPRKIMLMIKAGTAVDESIDALWPLLEPGDMIIDGGNSHYKDTLRRYKYLKVKRIEYVGMGISGGEEGALHGPSLMPGGTQDAWLKLEPILQSIAAKDFSGSACVSHIADDAAGHYVKMVHNGIEYAIMQHLAEIYDYLRKIEALSAEQIAAKFEEFGQGKSAGYLLETVPKVLRAKSENAAPLVDMILDSAEQKGTGAWTAMDALEIGAACPAIAEAVFARSVSAQKPLRERLAALAGTTTQNAASNISAAVKTFDFEKALYSTQNTASNISAGVKAFDFEKALYSATLLAFAQGLQQIQKAAALHSWNIDLAELCRIWQGGCIIRSKLLQNLQRIFAVENKLESPLEAKAFLEMLNEGLPDLRAFACSAIAQALPVPASAASLAWFDSMTSAHLPANLLQGLRDFFGAHTFQRTDVEGYFHHNWLNE